MMICSIVYSFAESAIKVEVNGIVYRLNPSNNTASVLGLNSSISDVDILDKIKYNDVTYSVTEILGDAFASKDEITSVKIPDSVVEIGYRAFWFCKNLQKVSWGQSIETIGNSAFGHCSNLKEAFLPNSVKIIGTMAFIGCDNLEAVNIPTSIVEIYSGAFEDCKNLKHIYIDDFVTWCSAFIYHADIFSANADLYSRGNLISNLIIPEDVETIAAMAFCGCGSIESITFPKNLKSIGYSCFELCPRLKEINIYSDIEIGSWCFGRCSQLKIVNVYSIIPPTIESDPFYESFPEYMVLHVPQGTKETYNKANVWKDFGTIIDDLPNDESGIEDVVIGDGLIKYIYDLNGVCVFSGISDYKLPVGVYIIRQGSNRKKMIIR